MILGNANAGIPDTKPFERTTLTFAVRTARGYRLLLTRLQPVSASVYNESTTLHVLNRQLPIAVLSTIKP
jgi:hypothetical protein